VTNTIKQSKRKKPFLFQKDKKKKKKANPFHKNDLGNTIRKGPLFLEFVETN
jgi:hypothetical protein